MSAADLIDESRAEARATETLHLYWRIIRATCIRVTRPLVQQKRQPNQLTRCKKLTENIYTTTFTFTFANSVVVVVVGVVMLLARVHCKPINQHSINRLSAAHSDFLVCNASGLGSKL